MSDIPWSIKNNTIDGNLTVSGQTTEWLGVLFNRIGRNATLTDITVTDEHPGAPGVYIVQNTIGRNLTCFGTDPGSVRRLRPRRGERRRPPRDRSVRIPGLTSFAPGPSATRALRRVAGARRAPRSIQPQSDKSETVAYRYALWSITKIAEIEQECGALLDS